MRDWSADARNWSVVARDWSADARDWSADAHKKISCFLTKIQEQQQQQQESDSKDRSALHARGQKKNICISLHLNHSKASN